MLLPDGPKLVGGKRKFRPKSAPDRPLFERPSYLNLYEECCFAHTDSTFSGTFKAAEDVKVGI